MKRILQTLKQMDPKRVALLALGPGVAAVAADAAIAHFAGREMAHPAQLLPVTVGPLAAVVLLAAVNPKVVRAAGAVLAALGSVGTFFHARAFLRLLAGQRLDWGVVQNALAAAPPVAAPGAFIGLGVVVWLLASPALRIQFDQPAAALKVPAIAAAANDDVEPPARAA